MQEFPARKGGVLAISFATLSIVQVKLQRLQWDFPLRIYLNVDVIDQSDNLRHSEDISEGKQPVIAVIAKVQ